MTRAPLSSSCLHHQQKLVGDGQFLTSLYKRHDRDESIEPKNVTAEQLRRINPGKKVPFEGPHRPIDSCTLCYNFYSIKLFVSFFTVRVYCQDAFANQIGEVVLWSTVTVSRLRALYIYVYIPHSFKLLYLRRSNSRDILVIFRSCTLKFDNLDFLYQS